MQPRRRHALRYLGVLSGSLGVLAVPALRAAIAPALRAGVAASTVVVAGAGPALAQPASGKLAPTPSQPEGPFYPRTIPADHDADLVRVDGRAQPAKGTVLRLSGAVSGDDGLVLEGALVEIWQCDANGRYHHVDDGGGALERDPNFQGYGQTRTGRDGTYRFRTIRPVPYPGRAPHIHLRVAHPRARTLTTQMYVAGDSIAGESGYFSRMSGRDRLTVALSAPTSGQEAGELEGRFDLVLALR